MSKEVISKIVTFSCSSSVHVYYKGGAFLPRPPYNVHDSILAAVFQLQERGIESPKIIHHK